MKKFLLLIVLALAILFTPRVALAHASLVACAPRIGANLTKPPSQIVCLFDLPIAPDKISAMVTAPNGQRVDKNDARAFEGDRYSIVVSLDTTKMTDGIYLVSYQVIDPVDNGETSGTVQFGVNTVVPPTPTVVLPGQVILTPNTQTPTTTTTDNSVSELISRFLIGLGAILLVAMLILFWRMRQRTDVETNE